MLKVNDYDLAIKSYDKALELDPNFYNAYYNKACLFSLKSDELNAIYNLEKSIKGDLKYIELAKTDSDFNNIRNMKEFKELLKN